MTAIDRAIERIKFLFEDASSSFFKTVDHHDKRVFGIRADCYDHCLESPEGRERRGNAYVYRLTAMAGPAHFPVPIKKGACKRPR